MGMRAGVFVTGTDTGIGKTVVSACLVQRWDADYWKPVQTGLVSDEGDSAVVARLAGALPGRIHTPRFSLQAALSPEAAARLEGTAIAPGDFTLPGGTAPLVVEGAGGVLVPLGGGALIADLIGRLGLPVLLVARTGLGTINHTLLSLEALRGRGLAVLGVVMVGAGGAENAEAIGRFGRVRVLAMLPVIDPLTPQALAGAALALPEWRELPSMAPGSPETARA